MPYTKPFSNPYTFVTDGSETGVLRFYFLSIFLQLRYVNSYIK